MQQNVHMPENDRSTFDFSNHSLAEKRADRPSFDINGCFYFVGLARKPQSLQIPMASVKFVLKSNGRYANHQCRFDGVVLNAGNRRCE